MYIGIYRCQKENEFMYEMHMDTISVQRNIQEATWQNLIFHIEKFTKKIYKKYWVIMNMFVVIVRSRYQQSIAF